MRKPKISNILKILLILIVTLSVLSIPVTTRQGINYSTRIIKIPLYIKITEFMNRDYHYRMSVKDIVKECKSEKEKVLAIFKWVCQNIKTDIPKGWPIVDDHVWSIIVRGYGVRDQLADVFVTLCVYAGFDTRLKYFNYDTENDLIISAVKVNGKWTLFDPYYGIYFTTPSGKIATVKDLLANPTLLESQAALISHCGIKYSEYFKNLSSIDFDKLPVPRAYKQTFFGRITFEMKRIFVKR